MRLGPGDQLLDLFELRLVDRLAGETGALGIGLPFAILAREETARKGEVGDVTDAVRLAVGKDVPLVVELEEGILVLDRGVLRASCHLLGFLQLRDRKVRATDLAHLTLIH